MNDGTFNFCDKSGERYIGDGTDNAGNGVVDKNIVEAKLPKYFDNVRIYGTWTSTFEGIKTLKSVFVPKTYKILRGDFCVFCSSLESVVFEDNSQIETIEGWFVQQTSVASITLPSSLKKLSSKSTFYGCTKLKQILFLGKIAVGNEYNDIFTNVPSDLVIIVSKDYPSTTFGGRNVNAISLPPTKRILTCLKKHNMKTSLLFMIFICYSL